MSKHVMFLSVPGLRPGDVSEALTPCLSHLVAGGGRADLRPTFPCVTSPVQASMLTGTPPGEHGVIANGFYYRDRHEVEFWVAPHTILQRPSLFQMIRERSGGEVTSAVWHAQNIKGAAADFIVTPSPIHEPDGTTKLWCYSKPDGLYEQLVTEFDHFPLRHYWGPLAGLPSSKWIVEAAVWLIHQHRPNFHYVYRPHLDYAAQRAGPDSPQAGEALREFDALIGEFACKVAGTPIAENVTWVVASEYAMTEVSGVVYPNRLLRDAGLLKTRTVDNAELIDFESSNAFAMVDHQFAHVFVRGVPAERVAEVFAGVAGVDGVYCGDRRGEIGMNHERSGEVVLIARDDRWFAYYWWLDDAAAPAFARTVDIHRKPGYDPVEQFFDPATKSIPLDATLVRGSHGVPVSASKHCGVILSNDSTAFGDRETVRDTDVAGIVLSLLGL